MISKDKVQKHRKKIKRKKNEEKIYIVDCHRHIYSWLMCSILGVFEIC